MAWGEQKVQCSKNKSFTRITAKCTSMLYDYDSDGTDVITDSFGVSSRLCTEGTVEMRLSGAWDQEFRRGLVI